MARRLAERVASLQPSATVEMTERVREARASGRQIIGLSSGDPNIETDARIIAAAERAMRGGRHALRSGAGPAGLARGDRAARARCARGVRYDPADIIVTPGGKFALLTALMGDRRAGDEVLVPEPGWVSYGPCVRLCGGMPVALSMLDRSTPRAARAPRLAAHQGAHRQFAGQPDGPRLAGGRDRPGSSLSRERHDLWIVFDQVYSDLAARGQRFRPRNRRRGQGARARRRQPVEDLRHDRLAPRLSGAADGHRQSRS